MSDNLETKNTSKTIQTLILSMGSIFVICLSMAMAAVLSRLLGKEDYGTFRQVLYVYTCIAVVFQVGLPKATSYFLPKLPLDQGKSALKQIVMILIGSGLICSGLLYFGADIIGGLLKNQDLPKLLRAYAPMPTFLLPALALQGTCMTFSKAGAYTVFQIVTKLLALCSVCLPIYLGYSMVQAIQLWCAVSFISMFIAVIMMFRPYWRIIATSCKYGFKDILTFCLPLLVASVLSTIVASADRFLVSRYLGTKIFAEYINGAIEFPLISIIASSTAAVLLPIFSRLHENPDGKDEILKVWGRAISKTTMLLYPMATLCFVYAEDIISILYSDRYSSSAIYFRIYLLLSIVRVISYMPLMIGIGALRSYVYGHILACIFMWGMGGLICVYTQNPVYIAMCFVFSVFIMVVVFFIGISQKLDVRIGDLVPYRQISIYLWMAFVSGVVAWLLTRTIPSDGIYMHVIRLCVGFAVFASVYLLISRLAGVNSLEFLRPVFVRLGIASK